MCDSKNNGLHHPWSYLPCVVFCLRQASEIQSMCRQKDNVDTQLQQSQTQLAKAEKDLQQVQDVGAIIDNTYSCVHACFLFLFLQVA